MKKAIAYLMVTIILLTIGGLGYTIYNKLLEAEEVRSRIALLPHFDASRITAIVTDSMSAQPVIINYFNTKCRFCQAEIQSILQHDRLLNESRVVLISDERKRVIEVFARSVGLDTSRLEVRWDSSGTIKDLFGVEEVPATFVYGVDSLLIQNFKGETKADVLYKLIK